MPYELIYFILRGVCRILKRGVKFGIPHGIIIIYCLFVTNDIVVKIGKIDNQEIDGEKNSKFCTF